MCIAMFYRYEPPAVMEKIAVEEFVGATDISVDDLLAQLKAMQTKTS